jgi:hypothetical protein
LETGSWADSLQTLSALEEYHRKIFIKNTSKTSYEILNTIQATADKGVYNKKYKNSNV